MSAPRVPVAIVGIGCRFPGGANDPEAFWDLIRSGRDPVAPMPAGRFDVSKFLHPEPGTPGKMVTADGGFLNDIDMFDAAFFGLSPREARKIDPQHRLLLEVAWEALEDAGIPVTSLAGRRVGVYVGVWSGEYENVMYRTPTELDFHSITGGGRYAASGRISYAFDLRGPAMTVDTGCSASLVALHLARQAIETGEADLAIVGAANLVLQPHVNVGYSRSGMLSSGARCRFGDADAAGYVRSDGVAALVLKPLERARRERDRVRGVMLATGVNADGRGSGQLATPSADAQAELLEAVYARAGVDPSSVTYVEAHGTGTRAGDPVELEALGRVLGRGRSADAPLVVGSVKTIIGHTEAAAGMAGLIKTLLALEHREIPANLHLRTPNETIAWGDLRVEIPTSARPWPAGAPLVAGVSSFGITGTNAHAVVAAAPIDVVAAGRHDDERPRVVTISAATEEGQIAAVQRLAVHIAADPDVSLRDVAFTTTCRRTHLSHRVAVVAASAADLRTALEERLAGAEPAAMFTGEPSTERTPRIGFVFSGQGSQWLGMGAELMATEPVFAEAIKACEAALAPHVTWSLTDVLTNGEPDLSRIDVVQPALGAVQVSLARLLESWGISADAVAGHSMGELPAAHIAGALSLDDAMRVLVERSRLLASIAGHGAMALCDLDVDETLARIARFGDRISIGAMNGPRSTVVSGDPAAVAELLAELDDAEIFARAVRVDVASHSTQCEPLLPALASAIAHIRAQPSRARLYSTVDGALRDEPVDADYWTRNLRQPVRLLPAIRAMLDDGVDVLVEIAPHPILLSSLADIAAADRKSVATVGLLRRDEPELQRMGEALARLYVAGAAVNWAQLADRDARPLTLPHYPWQRERYWLDEWEDWSGDVARGARTRFSADEEGWLYSIEWTEAAAVITPFEGAARRWLVIGDPSELSDAVRRGLTGAGLTAEIVPPSAAELRKQLIAGHDVIAGIILIPRARDGSGSDALDLMLATSELTQTLLAHAPARPPRLLVVTRGAQHPLGRPGTTQGVAQAPLWGFMRVLRDEHPEIGVRLLDLDPADDAAECSSQIVASARDGAADTDVAVHAGRRLVPRLVRAQPPQAVRERSVWPVDGATLITGGLGDLGLAVAKQLVSEGVRRLVLLSRTPLPPRNVWRTLDPSSADGRRTAAVLELEANGAAVHTASVDVGDRAQLRAFLTQYRADAWPDIVAIVHTAGVIDSHLVRAMPRTALAAAFRGKVEGAWLLHEELSDVRRFVMFSSTSVLIPQAGEANYAAANAYLDALCAVRRAVGMEAQVVNWGVWRDSGVIANVEGARYVDEVRRQGIDSMDPAAAVQVFTRLAAAGTQQMFVAPIDWQRLRATRGAVHLGPVFEQLTASDGEGVTGTAGQVELLAQLASVPAADRRALLESQLRDIAARVLSVRPERLRADATLGSQGLDSLMALELRNHIEGSFDLKVSATLAWNYPTLVRLSAHLLERLAERLDAGISVSDGGAEVAPAFTPVGIADTAVSTLIRDVAVASEEDILRELRGDA